jgi:hypothetical protein
VFFPFNLECNLAFSAIYKVLVVLRKGLPIIIDRLSYSCISNIKRSVGIYTLATTTGTFLHIPIGIAINFSAICNVTSLGTSLSKLSSLYKEKGITLTPAPKSHTVYT